MKNIISRHSLLWRRKGAASNVLGPLANIMNNTYAVENGFGIPATKFATHIIFHDGMFIRRVALLFFFCLALSSQFVCVRCCCCCCRQLFFCWITQTPRSIDMVHVTLCVYIFFFILYRIGLCMPSVDFMNSIQFCVCVCVVVVVIKRTVLYAFYSDFQAFLIFDLLQCFSRLDRCGKVKTLNRCIFCSAFATILNAIKYVEINCKWLF